MELFQAKLHKPGIYVSATVLMLLASLPHICIINGKGVIVGENNRLTGTLPLEISQMPSLGR